MKIFRFRKVFDVYSLEARGAREAEKVFESLKSSSSAASPAPRTNPQSEGEKTLQDVKLTRIDREKDQPVGKTYR